MMFQESIMQEPIGLMCVNKLDRPWFDPFLQKRNNEWLER
ncbi:hypothetical protein Cflav_PD6386 [Pedosphaera parvula Ellin514]|uniref:Uncharacterized protein n=1 Tax=Pedosphaera parvula (strain Ellin514) TaxID=320771 RepID=B9XDG5_PEDPL|nr:hypothetical protein Cflav_PD6386 [Pedosphaera parvula Ellin514]